MLDIKFIRENTEAVKKAVTDKGIDLDLDLLLQTEAKVRAENTAIEKLRKERNEIAEKLKSIDQLDEPTRTDLINKGREIKEIIGEKEERIKGKEEKLKNLMLLVPNIPSGDTPIGGEQDFEVIDVWGEIPRFDFKIKDHIELGKSLDILDLERGVKVAGYRGYFLKNEGLLLHQGLLNLALQRLVEKGFIPMQTPTIVKEFALVGSGHFPFGRPEIYELEEFTGGKEKETKFLVGTAEPSLLAYHADEVLNANDLPIRLCGISPCYRREVGGYGKDTRGIYRVHEFMKVEQVVICKADLQESKKLFEEINNSARQLLKELELPHRVIKIATGDMGAGKYKMYDIETWFAARNAYGETHSNSNLTDWQARRLNIKYREHDGWMKFAYTLNNTMIASPRILIAILENNQQQDGSVKVPKVLQNFMGKKVIKPKK